MMMVAVGASDLKANVRSCRVMSVEVWRRGAVGVA